MSQQFSWLRNNYSEILYYLMIIFLVGMGFTCQEVNTNPDRLYFWGAAAVMLLVRVVNLKLKVGDKEMETTVVKAVSDAAKSQTKDIEAIVTTLEHQLQKVVLEQSEAMKDTQVQLKVIINETQQKITTLNNAIEEATQAILNPRQNLMSVPSVAAAGIAAYKHKDDKSETEKDASEGIGRRNVDSDDPRKGQFGGSPVRNGRELSAVVKPLVSDPNWYSVVMTVKAVLGFPPLKDKVVFYLHDTFTEDEKEVKVNLEGIARLRLTSWGAFTVGAVCDDGTQLELDLAELRDAPEEFRKR